MAQHRRERATMRVYVPEPGVHVQTASSEEHPGGQVIHLTHGWQDLPPELANHSALSRLKPDDHAEALSLAEQARQEVLAKATSDFVEQAVRLDTENSEGLQKREEERAKQIDEHAAEPFVPEEHPDPIAVQSISLTAPNENANQRHMVSSAGMASKHPGEVVVPPVDPDAPAPPTSPPINVDVPYISGTGAIAETLNCTMGNWENEPTNYVYQWKSDGNNTGSGGPTYQIAAGDVGRTITCVVTAFNALGSAEAPPSNPIVVPATVTAVASTETPPPNGTPPAHPRRTTV